MRRLLAILLMLSVLSACHNHGMDEDDDGTKATPTPTESPTPTPTPKPKDPDAPTLSLEDGGMDGLGTNNSVLETENYQLEVQFETFADGDGATSGNGTYELLNSRAYENESET